MPSFAHPAGAWPGSLGVKVNPASHTLQTEDEPRAMSRTTLGSRSFPPQHMRKAIIGLESLLSSRNGVYPFTDDPSCILRISATKADRSVVLSDGTPVRHGDPLIELHWTNERLPRIPEHGPDLGWATAMRRGIETSLRALARYLVSHERDCGAAAIHASMVFGTRLGSGQVDRWARRIGFELIEREPAATLGTHLRGIGDGLLLLGLTWAFNPGGLKHKPFFRDRYEIWISRATLLDRFGECPRPDSAPDEQH